MRLIENLKKENFFCLIFFFTLYIGINLIGGEKLISYFDKKKTFEELIEEEKVLTSELNDLIIKF